MNSTYPLTPGFKTERPETSRRAAESVAGRAEDLRNKSLAVVSVRPSTADEVADALGEDRLSVRPRMTELLRLGKVEDSGERRKNASGRSAAVWRAVFGSPKQQELALC